jgi:hypothetical protein
MCLNVILKGDFSFGRNRSLLSGQTLSIFYHSQPFTNDNGHLWREVTDQASRYSDVNLITMQGKDQREATGKPEESIIWVPKLINGKAVDLRIAHSTEQWSWDYIRRMGDPENDPRFIDEIHNATELEPANAETPDFLIVDPKARLTPVDLSRYDATSRCNCHHHWNRTPPIFQPRTPLQRCCASFPDRHYLVGTI